MDLWPEPVRLFPRVPPSVAMSSPNVIVWRRARLRSGGGAFTAQGAFYLAPDVPTRGGAPAEKESMGRLWSSSPRPANARAKPNPAFVKSKAISALCVSQLFVD